MLQLQATDEQLCQEWEALLQLLQLHICNPVLLLQQQLTVLLVALLLCHMLCCNRWCDHQLSLKLFPRLHSARNSMH